MYSEKPKLHMRQKSHQHGRLRTIALDVTPLCNMNCSHCYAETFAKAKPIELEILHETVDELYKLGVYHYVMQGGEPICDPERLEKIIRMCHPDETYINVVTNGWDMTERKIEWLKGLKVDKITFSLDSGIEGEHDLRRKLGSHGRVIKGVDNVLKAGLLSSISIVVTHESLYSEGFRKAYEFARNKGIRMDVQIAEPVGKWDGKKEYLLTPEDSRYMKQMQSESPVLSNGQIMINRDIFTGEFDHCPAGTEFMGITADGEFLPCNFLQYTLGNIRDRSVKDMRSDLLTNEWFDGSRPNCLCGENESFIDRYIMPYIHGRKPLDAYAIFNIREGHRGERV